MKRAFRTILSASASAGILASMLPATGIAFSDVSGSPFKNAIDALEKSGVVEGYDDGTYKPDQMVNRGEFLKIVLEARDATGFTGSNCFPDVKNEWFAKYVCTAKNEEIIEGYPTGFFKPEQTISFVEAGKILTLAYEQQLQGGSTDWYEPYARALEASKAIPESIDALDHPLTRGEMAEMMYRLSENITDRPSKGYLNVKYPEIRINTSSDDVQMATSCADLRAFTEEAQKSGGSDMQYRMMEGDALMNEAMPAMSPQEGAANAKTSGSDGDYSQTNVQVAGVDEGDIVKTDGTYLYIVNNQRVRIVRAVPATNMDEVASIDFEDSNFIPTDLYVEGNRLIVLGSSWNQGGPVHIMDSTGSPQVEKMASPMIWPGPSYNTQKAQVRIYDISDKNDPELARKVSFDGNTVSSRRIGDKLYVVINQSPMYWGGPLPLSNVKEDDILPRFSDSANGDVEKAVANCGDVAILPHVPSPQYLVVGVIPVNDKNKAVETEVVLGSAENIYASLNNIFVATTEWSYHWEKDSSTSSQKTNVYRFEYEDDGINLESQGTVDGRILNQFSMDEHESNFRIATTIDNWTGTGNKSSNNLFVLNMSLDQVGEITDIAPGETIYSVRFMGNRAYMVTFKRVDPLFVIDTSDPRNPKILGKLKIPGYSDYLHPYDENHLIGFGKEVDESIDADKVHDDDAVYYTAVLGMKLALFDVTDVSNPKEMYKVVIGDRGTESPVLYNHKALLFEKERNLLSFPVSVMEFPSEVDPKNESAYPTQSFQGAHVYTLTLKDGFKKQGEVTHYDSQDTLKSGDYYYGKDIERIVRIGETLYSISQAAVQSNVLNGLKEQDSVTFSTPVVDDVVYPTR